MRFFIWGLLLVNLYSSEINKDDINGIWEIPEEISGQFSIGEIFSENDRAFAYVFEYLQDMNGKFIRRDIENEESNAHTLARKIFIANLKFDEGKWSEGRIYNPNDGQIYHIKAELSSDKQTLSLRVSLDSFGILGKTLQWRRIQDLKYLPPSHDNITMIEALQKDGE